MQKAMARSYVSTVVSSRQGLEHHRWSYYYFFSERRTDSIVECRGQPL